VGERKEKKRKVKKKKGTGKKVYTRLAQHSTFRFVPERDNVEIRA
jgi:hypothetical protein